MRTMHLPQLLLIAAGLRAGLLLFGEVQDRCLHVKYTDVDYAVFTDAAHFVSLGGSPYQRSMYRYSPLLAYLLLPNVWLASWCGKALFSVCDIVVGWLVARLVGLQGASQHATTAAVALWLFNPWTFTISTRGSCDVLVVVLLLSMLLWLHQGRDKLAAVAYGLAVHLRIYPIIYAPAIVFFLAARAVKQQQGAKQATLTFKCLHTIHQGLRFGLLSGSLFVGLHLLFSRLYDPAYTQEAFLHHLTRKDHRHNFSIYYYSIYLSYADLDNTNGTQPSPPQLPAHVSTLFTSMQTLSSTPPAELLQAGLQSLSNVDLGHAARIGLRAVLAVQPSTLLCAGARAVHSLDVKQWLLSPAACAFVPQACVLLAMALVLHADLALCCLLQTICFVAFNKVCTAQYFVWWMSLLPLVTPRIPWPLPRPLLTAAAFWGAMQLHWLAWAYLLEFQGMPVHLGVWVASLLFLAANVVLVVQLLKSVDCKGGSFLARSLKGGPCTEKRAL